MTRFGKNKLYWQKRSAFRRLIFHILGDDFSGSTIRFFHFRRALRNLSFRRCLDAGCGTGDFAFYVAGKCKQCSVDAYDISGDAIRECSRIKSIMGLDNIIFQKKDILKMRDDRKYDFIFSLVTMIYFTDRQNKAILKNMYTALKEGGFLYLDLPTKTFNEFQVIPEIYYKKWSKHTSEQQAGCLYSPQELEAILKSIGFEVIYIQNTFGYAGRLAWEIDAIMKGYKLERIKLMLMPALKIMAWLDSMVKNKNGSCVCTLCRKQKGIRGRILWTV